MKYFFQRNSNDKLIILFAEAAYWFFEEFLSDETQQSQ